LNPVSAADTAGARIKPTTRIRQIRFMSVVTVVRLAPANSQEDSSGAGNPVCKPPSADLVTGSFPELSAKPHRVPAERRRLEFLRFLKPGWRFCGAGDLIADSFPRASCKAASSAN
jgi:hypothetical protein